MKKNQRTVASVGFLLGLYWLACGALMYLRPDLVPPQLIDPLHLNHGATLLGILYILAGMIGLVTCLIVFVRARSRVRQQPPPSRSVRLARVLAACLATLGIIAVPLVALVAYLAILWFVLIVLGLIGLLIAYILNPPSARA